MVSLVSCGRVVGLCLAVLAAGCGAPSNGTFTQEGSVPITGGGPTDVFYPVPYEGPPNLTLVEPWNAQVVEQRPDGFKFKISGSVQGGARVQWKAIGIRKGNHP